MKSPAPFWFAAKSPGLDDRTTPPLPVIESIVVAGPSTIGLPLLGTPHAVATSATEASIAAARMRRRIRPGWRVIYSPPSPDDAIAELATDAVSEPAVSEPAAPGGASTSAGSDSCAITDPPDIMVAPAAASTVAASPAVWVETGRFAKIAAGRATGPTSASVGTSGSGDDAQPAAGAGRQHQPELRALPGRAPGLEPAAVQPGVLEADRQTEAGAAGLPRARRIGPPEPVEDQLLLARTQADAVVADGDRDRASRRRRA